MKLSPPDVDVPFPVSIDVATLPKSGFPVSETANEAQLAAISAAYGLQSVSSFAITGRVFRWRSKGARFDGALKAQVSASCVVTDEPVPQTVNLSIEVTFVPDGSSLTRPRVDGDGELVVDLDANDPPETFTGTSIDLGAVVLELFSLEIDPFPRSPNAPDHIEFTTADDEQEADGEGQPSPFAALAALKQSKSDDRG